MRVSCSLELSVETGNCYCTLAYDWPGSVEILSISGGHVMLGAWISVEEASCMKEILKYNISNNINNKHDIIYNTKSFT